MRSRVLLAVFLSLLGFASAVEAKVFHSRQEALALAFPDADRVDSQTHILDERLAERIQSLARSPLETRLVRIHTGFDAEGRVLGYAVIDVHNVRTQPEAFMVVLSPQGDVQNLRVLAFHEPLDYLPPPRWYRQFDAVAASSPLRLGRDIHGIVGATLSARATTQGVRRALAYYDVLLRTGVSH